MYNIIQEYDARDRGAIQVAWDAIHKEGHPAIKRYFDGKCYIFCPPMIAVGHFSSAKFS